MAALRHKALIAAGTFGQSSCAPLGGRKRGISFDTVRKRCAYAALPLLLPGKGEGRENEAVYEQKQASQQLRLQMVGRCDEIMPGTPRVALARLPELLKKVSHLGAPASRKGSSSGFPSGGQRPLDEDENL